MRGIWVQMLLLLLLAGWLAPLAAAAAEGGADGAEPRVLLAEASELYREGSGILEHDPALGREKLSGALLRYERLLTLGVRNGRLYYNIGNTYFKLGDQGRALLNFRRAQRYLGDEPRLVRSLALLQAGLPGSRPERAEPGRGNLLRAGRELLPVAFQRWIFGLSYCLGFVLLGHAAFRHRWTRVLPWIGVAFGVAGLLLAALLISGQAAARARPGVVLDNNVVVRQGDGEHYPPLTDQPLAAGCEFTLLEKRGTWYHIQLADSRQGWIKARSAELVNNDAF